MHEHVKLSLVCQEQCKYNMLLRGLESMEAVFDGGFKDRRQLMSTKTCKSKRGKRAIFRYSTPVYHLNDQHAFTSASNRFGAVGSHGVAGIRFPC